MSEEQRFEKILIEEVRKINQEAWENIPDAEVWQFFMRMFDAQPALGVITKAAMRFKNGDFKIVRSETERGAGVIPQSYERGAGDDYPVIPTV